MGSGICLRESIGAPRPIRLASSLNERTDDRKLIELCREGDPEAWNILIRRYDKPVYKFAYTLARNYDDAAEIAGQVFLRLFENIHTIRNESSFTSWLFRIVRNVYIDVCVRAPHRAYLSLDDGVERDGNLLLHEAPDGRMSPEKRLLELEKKTLLDRAIHHLPSYQREMMEMYHSEGRSYEEISRMTGLSLGTVKSRLSRARNMLRERLSRLEDVFVTAT